MARVDLSSRLGAGARTAPPAGVVPFVVGRPGLAAAVEWVEERLAGSAGGALAGWDVGDGLAAAVNRAVADLPSGWRVPRQLVGAEVLRRLLGFGRLDELLGDPSVSDILVNRPDWVVVERHGRLEPTDVRFRDDAEVYNLAQRVVARAGRSLNTETPFVDARLPDGSRVNCIVPPLSAHPVISIRRRAAGWLDGPTWVANGSATPEILASLAAAVRGRLNLVVAGATGSGKTTLLRLLASWIPADQRVITIEDVAELGLDHPHVVALEANRRYGLHELLVNALRMRPDRILLGELRGSEAVELLDAMGTGHEGSMTTVHSRSPYEETIWRLARAMQRADLDMPFERTIEQIRETVDVVLFLRRLRSGQRIISHVVEVLPTAFVDLWRWDGDGWQRGDLTSARTRRLAEEGVTWPA